MTTEDDRCDQCKEFDKDGCPNCGPVAIGATYGLTPSEIADHPQRIPELPAPVPFEALREILKNLDSSTFRLDAPHLPNIASYVDNNPNNPIQICDSSGTQLMLMSAAEYAAILERTHVPMRAPSWADKYCDAEPEQPVDGEERGMQDAYSMVLPASLLHALARKVSKMSGLCCEACGSSICRTGHSPNRDRLYWGATDKAGTTWNYVGVFCDVCVSHGRCLDPSKAKTAAIPLAQIAGKYSLKEYLRITSTYRFTPKAKATLQSILLALQDFPTT